MSKQTKIYWYCQFFGWSFYFILNLVFFGLKYNYDYKYYLIIFLSLPLAISITHGYRTLILRSRFLTYKMPAQLLLIVLFSVLKAFLFFICITVISTWLGFKPAKLTFVSVLEFTINYTVPFCLWNIIYFGFKYFQNYRRNEINTLRLYAASRESELNNLKAQLNPHFMFNSMNSIRALVDEDPAKAKVAVTKLSNILRNTLLMNKNKLIPLKEEINLVKEYLDLEQIRYEERLSYELKVDDDVLDAMIPPFIIQAQVENAVKHGISKVPGRGRIIIEAFALGSILKIKVSNTGKISSETPLTGVGMVNSIQRLELLYGSAGKLFMSEVNNLVVVDINIPLK